MCLLSKRAEWQYSAFRKVQCNYFRTADGLFSIHWRKRWGRGNDNDSSECSLREWPVCPSPRRSLNLLQDLAFEQNRSSKNLIKVIKDAAAAADADAAADSPASTRTPLCVCVYWFMLQIRVWHSMWLDPAACIKYKHRVLYLIPWIYSPSIHTGSINPSKTKLVTCSGAHKSFHTGQMCDNCFVFSGFAFDVVCLCQRADAGNLRSNWYKKFCSHLSVIAFLCIMSSKYKFTRMTWRYKKPCVVSYTILLLPSADERAILFKTAQILRLFASAQSGSSVVDFQATRSLTFHHFNLTATKDLRPRGLL